MKVFVAGSTGVVGRWLVPLLRQQGHEVVALVRSLGRADWLSAAGAEIVVADALDREALMAAVRKSAPEVIVHQLTALTGVADFKRLDQQFAPTNRLRTEATDTLLDAGRQAGTRRFLMQSFCGWPFAREGGPVKTEDDALDPDPPESFRGTLAAIRHLEDRVRGAAAQGIEALALRYGMFYGPGTAIAKDGLVADLIRKRRLPIVGDGAGVWSFLHVQDAARATAAAVERGEPGIYNVVDDEPAPVATWLPYLAEALGAPPPHKVPVWVGKLAAGEGGVSMMTRVRGGANTKAKHALDWQPVYPSWRRGFLEGLA